MSCMVLQAAMAGQVQFKADRFGMLHATVGKVGGPSTAKHHT